MDPMNVGIARPGGKECCVRSSAFRWDCCVNLVHEYHRKISFQRRLMAALPLFPRALGAKDRGQRFFICTLVARSSIQSHSGWHPNQNILSGQSAGRLGGGVAGQQSSMIGRSPTQAAQPLNPCLAHNGSAATSQQPCE